ncbi:MAG: nucleotidyltransferase domain-containing protein [Sulfurimonas sp.]|nr:nucleotidyltransferase domain-containing protein [Sulfurimonas sp.]
MLLYKMIEKIIKDFEQESNCTVVYLSKIGSILYGTDDENSDTDYKGIFVPRKVDVLLKKDMPYYTSNSNNKNEKNTKDDIDLHLDSIFTFTRLLKKGETGAIDMLFSIFDSSTTIIADDNFTDYLKENYSKFYSKNLHSFVGYCVGQSKRYNIRGQRYNELVELNEYLKSFSKDDKKLELYFEDLKILLKDKKFRYIKFTTAPAPKSAKLSYDIPYLEVLGKKFIGAIGIDYLSSKLIDMQKQFGNRTKASVDGVDWKSLSHAYRIISEVQELLDTNFIKFPLQEKDYIYSIKKGDESLLSVMEKIDLLLDVVNDKLENSSLPQEVDISFTDNFILKQLEFYDK